ncbi:MAG: hypothetical protein IH946_06640 [Bacteroidetes bacterium]|nr:hypothetical protein [Bacteroidota bacterium]
MDRWQHCMHQYFHRSFPSQEKLNGFDINTLKVAGEYYEDIQRFIHNNELEGYKEFILFLIAKSQALSANINFTKGGSGHKHLRQYKAQIRKFEELLDYVKLPNPSKVINRITFSLENEDTITKVISINHPFIIYNDILKPIHWYVNKERGHFSEEQYMEWIRSEYPLNIFLNDSFKHQFSYDLFDFLSRATSYKPTPNGYASADQVRIIIKILEFALIPIGDKSEQSEKSKIKVVKSWIDRIKASY